MPSPEVERYCTLFDLTYLVHGLCLHESLVAHAQPFNLWILCMDEEVEAALRRLAPQHVSLMPLRELEDGRLLAVKPSRTRGEYCWTLSPFLPAAVLARDPSAPRVTYLDADLWFVAPPRPFFTEFEGSGKDVLITEHAYDPAYDHADEAGRFCVQFTTFARGARAGEVLSWWQERCLEWCFARIEPGRFGDQKYLDLWPEMFADRVHILAQVERTLAPWNVDHMASRGGGRVDPVFFHFHNLRVVAPRRLILWEDDYAIGEAGRTIYRAYAARYSAMRERVLDAGIILPDPPRRRRPIGLRWALRRLRHHICARGAYVKLPR